MKANKLYKSLKWFKKRNLKLKDIQISVNDSRDGKIVLAPGVACFLVDAEGQIHLVINYVDLI